MLKFYYLFFHIGVKAWRFGTICAVQQKNPIIDKISDLALLYLYSKDYECCDNDQNPENPPSPVLAVVNPDETVKGRDSGEHVRLIVSDIPVFIFVGKSHDNYPSGSETNSILSL